MDERLVDEQIDWNYPKCRDHFLVADFGLLVGKLYAATAGMLL